MAVYIGDLVTFFNNSLNIIYICTAEKGPSGGAKIIYNHSDQPWEQ